MNRTKNHPMTRIISSQITKKLLLQFIQENMDFRKRCVYLQEIILMSRKNDVWRKALTIFFDNISLPGLFQKK
jgi:hypothetical protein